MRYNALMNLDVIPIIRSRRKTLAVHIHRDGRVVVRAPIALPETLIQDFVLKQQGWIEKHVGEQATRPRPERLFCEGECFLLRGAEVKLELVEQGTQSLAFGDTFRLVLRDRFRARQIFEAWYKREARAHLTDRVLHYAERMQLEHGPIRLSSARHTWGSCAKSNRLSFSWRLIMAPEEVIDYVVVHELSHTVHKNHGKQFWVMVERFSPYHKKHRAWLRAHGHLWTI